jgi:ribosomal protein S18 acetylase RimI-like enzyme
MKPDLPAIHALFEESWQKTYAPIFGAENAAEFFAEWHDMAQLEARLNRPESEFVVADTGEAITGIGYAERDGQAAHLRQLYVDPERVFEGIGRELLTEIVQSFPEASAIRLLVEPANTGAIGFYEGFVFERTGETGHCGEGGKDVPALIYELTLAR